MIGRIILGLIMVAAGFGLVWKTQIVYGWVGRVPFAEKYIGPGGSRFFIKIIGLVVIFFGFTTIFNLNEPLIQSTLGKLFPKG